MVPAGFKDRFVPAGCGYPQGSRIDLYGNFVPAGFKDVYRPRRQARRIGLMVERWGRFAKSVSKKKKKKKKKATRKQSTKGAPKACRRGKKKISLSGNRTRIFTVRA